MTTKSFKKSTAILLAVLMLFAALSVAFAASAETGTPESTTQAQGTEGTTAVAQAGSLDGLLASLKTFIETFTQVFRPMIVSLTNAFQQLISSSTTQPGESQPQPSADPASDPTQPTSQTGVQTSDMQTILNGVIASFMDFIQNFQLQQAQPTQPAAN